jgi:hypothetical protein
MDDDALKALVGRVDGLDSRLQAIERREEDERKGWVSRFARLGIIVGCLGGIVGGAYTGVSMYNEVFAKANIVLIPGDRLMVSRPATPSPLTFSFGVALHNKGNAPGALRTSEAQLEIPTIEASQRLPPITLSPIRFTEKGADVVLPFSIKANEPRDVMVEAKLPHTSDLNTLLANRGLYSLVLRVTAPDAEQKIRYCFWLGEGSADQLKQGYVTFDSSDPRCSTTSK